MYSVQWEMYSVQCTVYIEFSTVAVYIIQCIGYSITFTKVCVQCILYSAKYRVCTVNSVFCIVISVQISVYGVQCELYMIHITI